MTIILGWARFLLWLFGLPILGWWLASWLVNDPPIVAPFLLVSPLHALTIAAGVFGYRHAKDARTQKRPLTRDESETLVSKYEAQLGRYSGKMALVADEYMLGNRHVLDGWLLINERTWNSLSGGAREFMLIRSATKGSRQLGRQILPSLYLLMAFVLASISLWLIIPIHIGAVVAAVMVSSRFASKVEQRLDKATMSITQDYKGAQDFIRQTKREKDRVGARLEALKQSASELGLLTKA